MRLQRHHSTIFALLSFQHRLSSQLLSGRLDVFALERPISEQVFSNTSTLWSRQIEFTSKQNEAHFTAA